MKIFFLLSFAVLNSWAAEIPLGSFDQAKIETILRKIPSAYFRSENLNGFVRKHYQYPIDSSLFKITCEADYYQSSPVPSEKRCLVVVSDKVEQKGDEYLIAMKSMEMFNALSYGQESKFSYSSEKVYGQAYEGNYRDLFRYVISCKKESCSFRFSSKEAF